MAHVLAIRSKRSLWIGEKTAEDRIASVHQVEWMIAIITSVPAIHKKNLGATNWRAIPLESRYLDRLQQFQTSTDNIPFYTRPRMMSIGTSNAPKLTLEPSVWFFAGQLDESEPVRRVPIASTPFQIGRRSDLALPLRCNSVSKLHAEIYEEDNELWVCDLGSTNGTYVNGQRIEEPVSVNEGDLVQFATMVFRIGCAQHDSFDGGTIQHNARDVALSMVQFDRLLHDDAVVPFYQPIVRVDDDNHTRVAYEVLGRSRLFGLGSPKEMFATASQLNLEAELSRVFRQRGIDIAVRFPDATHIYVNTHPIELNTPELIQSLRETRAGSPTMPITLEIHEAAVTKPAVIRKLRDVLRDLDMGLAFDDFGAGQARLVELSEVRPDCLKFDMQLVKGIASAPASRQQVVALLVKMVNELGITPLAEGVEDQADHLTLQQMGFLLGQGYYYGRPAAISAHVNSNDGYTDSHALDHSGQQPDQGK